MEKKKMAMIFLSVLLFATVIIVAIKMESKREVSPQEMLDTFEAVMGDEYKKQFTTEVVATLIYENGIKEENVYYHVLKTTYEEASPADVTGLHVEAFDLLFNPDTAESCQRMKIQDWEAALYKTSKQSYLCWTYSPEISYVLEYNPEAVTDEEIIKMAQSIKPFVD